MEYKDFTAGYMHRPLRTSKVCVITPHSLQGGKSTLDAVDGWYKERIRQGYASCSNYAISFDGKIGLYVPEDRRAATSSSSKNDDRAITVEIATEKDAPKYSLFKDAESAFVRLAVDLCRRWGRRGVELLTAENKFGEPSPGFVGITLHRWFSDTDCPGNDILEKLPGMIRKINATLSGDVNGDGRTDISDVSALLDGLSKSNGKADVSDVSALLDLLAQGEKAGEEKKILYRVQVGAFLSYENAVKAKERISGGAYIEKEDGCYKVFAGAYAYRKNAEKKASALNVSGVSAIIVEVAR